MRCIFVFEAKLHLKLFLKCLGPISLSFTLRRAWLSPTFGLQFCEVKKTVAFFGGSMDGESKRLVKEKAWQMRKECGDKRPNYGTLRKLLWWGNNHRINHPVSISNDTQHLRWTERFRLVGLLDVWCQIYSEITAAKIKNECLFNEFWSVTIFVIRVGMFLKLYTLYMKDYQENTTKWQDEFSKIWVPLINSLIF